MDRRVVLKMLPISWRFLKVLFFTTLCHYSMGAQADACIDFASRSLQQQDNNLFNLCSFRGSQWTGSKKDLIKACRTMSLRDQTKRLTMRDKLLASCPMVAESSLGPVGLEGRCKCGGATGVDDGVTAFFSH